MKEKGTESKESEDSCNIKDLRSKHKSMLELCDALKSRLIEIEDDFNYIHQHKDKESSKELNRILFFTKENLHSSLDWLRRKEWRPGTLLLTVSQDGLEGNIEVYSRYIRGENERVDDCCAATIGKLVLERYSPGVNRFQMEFSHRVRIDGHCSCDKVFVAFKSIKRKEAYSFPYSTAGNPEDMRVFRDKEFDLIFNTSDWAGYYSSGGKFVKDCCLAVLTRLLKQEEPRPKMFDDDLGIGRRIVDCKCGISVMEVYDYRD